MPSIYDSSHELLCRVMPNLASQLRQPLGNIYSALQRLMDQPAADREKRDQDLAVLYQSYYRLLRLVGNLSDAPTLLSDDPLPLANDDIVAFVHEICRRAEVPAELCGQRVIFESEKAVHVMAFPGGYYDTLSLVTLLENGFDISFSTEVGTNTLVKGMDQSLLALDRYNMNESVSVEEMLSYLA